MDRSSSSLLVDLRKEIHTTMNIWIWNYMNVGVLFCSFVDIFVTTSMNRKVNIVYLYLEVSRCSQYSCRSEIVQDTTIPRYPDGPRYLDHQQCASHIKMEVSCKHTYNHVKLGLER